ncbi:MAG: hypothetical protein ABIH08_06065 [Candidatus Omnitrophota bacterium]
MKLEKIYSTVLVWGVISREGVDCLRQENKLAVIAEGRPYLTGINYNIPLLKKEKIDFIYCTDNTLGLLFYKKKIAKTFFFYKEKTDNGLTGACGSLYAALLSKLHKVDIEVFPQGTANYEVLDKNSATLAGKPFILEEDKNSYIIDVNDEFVSLEVLG